MTRTKNIKIFTRTSTSGQFRAEEFIQEVDKILMARLLTSPRDAGVDVIVVGSSSKLNFNI